MADRPDNCPSPIDFAPTFADLLRDHPEVVQGQVYEQETNPNPAGNYGQSSKEY